MAKKALSEKNESHQLEKDTKIFKSLDENYNLLYSLMGKSGDFKSHDIKFGKNKIYSAYLFFIDGMVDNNIINQDIIKPLIKYESDDQKRDLITCIKEEVLYANQGLVKNTINEALDAILSGDTVIFVDGFNQCITISSKGYEKRAVTEPQSEIVVKGPREGFTENLRTNTSLIRRKIKSDKLRVDSLVLGKQTKTNVAIMYLDGIADNQVLSELKRRLDNIEVDAILESGYIEEYIEDAPFSPFSTVGYSEKPDVAAAKILEGRIILIVDGTPFVITLPLIFIENFQSAEDYYIRPLYASIIRFLRYISFFITVFSPGLYLALTTFNQELVPTTLLITIAVAREQTPFPAVIEALIMIFAFEILKEAGIRLPKPTGQAISIVGALIMGEAAISAGFVGAPMVITIGITAVAAFLIPNQNESTIVIRLIMVFLGAFLGLFGIAMGFLGLLIHLASLNSFGIPYFDGLSRISNLKDSFIRVPFWMMNNRPKNISGNNKKRRKTFIPSFRPYENDKKEDEK